MRSRRLRARKHPVLTASALVDVSQCILAGIDDARAARARANARAWTMVRVARDARCHTRTEWCEGKQCQRCSTRIRRHRISCSLSVTSLRPCSPFRWAPRLSCSSAMKGKSQWARSATATNKLEHIRCGHGLRQIVEVASEERCTRRWDWARDWQAGSVGARYAIE